MTSRAPRHAHVVVVGGGYAGAAAAGRATRTGARVTVVDPSGAHAFTTRAAAVAGGTAGVGDAFAPLAQLLDRVEVVAARVSGLADGHVRLDDGRIVRADAVVVAVGSRPTQPPIEGIEHTQPLRTAGDALELRGRLHDASSLVVAGGGPTGVQLAAAAKAARPERSVTLVELTDRLLGTMDPQLGRHAGDVLGRIGVDVRLEAELVAAAAEEASLADGGTLRGLVVWAGGFAADAAALLPRAETDGGRALVDADLMVRGHPGIFAAGDVAAHRTRSGETLAMSAQIATRAGDLAGANAARWAAGRPTEPAELSQQGWVIELTPGRAVAEVGPLTLADRLTDRVAGALHLAIDLRHVWRVGGPRSVARFAPHRHRPPTDVVEQVARTGRHTLRAA